MKKQEQWYNANTGEPLDMTLPSMVAFRKGASMDKVAQLAKPGAKKPN